MSEDDINFASMEFPWPEKGDRLFQSDKDWWHNACLNYAHDDWELYIGGYRKAGEILVHHISDTHRDQDYLVYPIVFVYRQYLELRIKKLIRDCKLLLDEDPDFPKGHNLVNLWGECKRLLNELETKPDKKDMEAVDEGILQFCETDPSSESFRYPVKVKGDKPLPTELKYINVRHLAEIMAKISGFLEAGRMVVSELQNYKQDMERGM